MAPAGRFLIIGIDPGSRNTGYAVLEFEGNSHTVHRCDVLRLDSDESHGERLKKIFNHVSLLVDQYKPHAFAIETPVYGKDPTAMLKLGRAQAAAILAAQLKDVDVFEYLPKTVKKSITGNGNAAKEQVAYMLHRVLNMPEDTFTADATDALAVAWCHAMQLRSAIPAASRPATGKGSKKGGWEAFAANNPDRVKTAK
jgi:crossover junction endodeoxyribonuclease RuvC